MSASKRPAGDPVAAYAREVVAGHVVTGRLVRLACQRHLDDLDTGAARALRFDALEAQAAIDFWEMCPHLKGKAAARGETLRLEPWQAFIVGSVYGWKRAVDGRERRRFRVAWIEVARKNGKSTLLYPAGLHALALDGEAGAEVYSIATKRDQAKLVFDLAKRAVEKSPDLLALIEPRAFQLVCADTFGLFSAQSSDASTLDGLNPSAALCDEMHKWKGRALWDVIETGMGAREQPLLWAITTAGEEGDENVYGQEHNHTVEVLEGVVVDDSRFGFVACLDPGDSWTDSRNFIKANPNLGVSVDAGEIADQVRKAERMPAAANSVKRLRLGLRTQDVDAWIPLQLWDAGRADKLTWEHLKGFACYGGLDLASTSDFAALSLCFPLTEDLEPAPDPDRPAVWGYLFKLWIPAEAPSHLGSKLREIAAPWINDGWVDVTPGNSIDPTAIEAGVSEAAAHFDLIGLAYDPFNAASFAARWQAEGIAVHQCPNRLTFLAEPTKLFGEDLSAGRMRHGGNPCARWMANNVVVVGDAAGHRMPSRKRSTSKIDGIAAAVMARGRAVLGGGERPSFYDTNGVETV